MKKTKRTLLTAIALSVSTSSSTMEAFAKNKEPMAALYGPPWAAASRGDVNWDHVIDAKDLATMLTFQHGDTDVVYSPELADIDLDGVSNAKDIKMLLNYLTGFTDAVKLAEDVDGDMQVEYEDLLYLEDAIEGGYADEKKYDINHDGKYDQEDIAILKQYLKRQPLDLDSDSNVNLKDLKVLVSALKQSVDDEKYDLTNDGKVNINDVNKLANMLLELGFSKDEIDGILEQLELPATTTTTVTTSDGFHTVYGTVAATTTTMTVPTYDVIYGPAPASN